ncbi:MAG: hypothetical protein K2P90_03665, partial [Holosporales bacterium]|nr:hypothetical protein [Holosporales bacterium]
RSHIHQKNPLTLLLLGNEKPRTVSSVASTKQQKLTQYASPSLHQYSGSDDFFLHKSLEKITRMISSHLKRNFKNKEKTYTRS